MTLKRGGACNHCGKCCKPPVIVEGPTIKRGEDRCVFYVERGNDKLYEHCLIYGADSIERAKDRSGKAITKEQLVWFNENCVEYPTAEDAEKGYRPPPECSFSFEVTDG